MYISAMWVRSSKSGTRGENVVIYKHPNGLPHDGDLNKIIQEPGKKEDAIKYIELRQGGNRVQAALEFVCEDKDYDRTAILRALGEQERGIGMYVSTPIPIEASLGSGMLRGVFTSYMGPMDPESARAVFSLLRGAIDRALALKNDQIAA